MTDDRPILLVGEEMPTCPECGRRLSASDRPVMRDDDGPIYVGTCPEHGTWPIQEDAEEEDDG